jgi:hypothetical protein
MSPLALCCSAWFEKTVVGNVTDIALLVGARSIVVDFVIEQRTILLRGTVPSPAFITLSYVAFGKLSSML